MSLRAAASLALLLALVILWPLPFLGADTLPTSPQGEGATHLWGWWLAWQSRQPFGGATTLLAWPAGTSLTLIDPWNALLWAPLGWWSPAAGYQAVVVFMVALSGLAGWSLARETGATPGGQVLGVAAGVSAATLLGAVVDGVTEGLGSGLVGLHFGALLLLRRGTTPGRLVWVGASLVAAVHAGPYNAVWLALGDVALGLVLLRHTRLHVVVGALAGLLCLPFLWAVAQRPAGDVGSVSQLTDALPSFTGAWRGAWLGGADLLDLVVPAPLTGPVAAEPATAYLGVVLVTLALRGAWVSRRPLLLLPPLAFALLALGPWVAIAGDAVRFGGGVLPGPAWLLEQLGPLQGMTRWYRAGGVAVLLLVPAAVQLLRGRWALVAALLVMLDARLLSPLPWQLPRTEMPGVTAMAGLEGALLHLPPHHGLHEPDHIAGELLLWQVRGGQPGNGVLHAGDIGRVETPELRLVRRLALGQPVGRTALHDALEVLRGQGFTWLVVWKERVELRGRPTLELALGPPRAEDSRVVVWGLEAR
jgi:hypothetical protein